LNLIVCLKHVPDTEAKIHPTPDGKKIDESRIKFIVNPYDEFAVEEAIRIKEKTGDGRVTILSVGSEDSLESVRTALAMGADEGILLKADPWELDPGSTARILADKLAQMEFDLLLFGRQAIDDGASHVGVAVATLLKLPVITDIIELEIREGSIRAKRETEAGTETLEAPLPAVVTTQKGLNEPRYTSLKGIMKAKRQQIPVEEAEIPSPASTIEKFEPPPARPPGRIVGQGAEAVPELLRLLREERKIL